MTRPRLLLIGCIAVVAALAAVAFLALQDDGPGTGDLERAAEVMAAASFASYGPPCPQCRGDSPPVVEHAPANRLMVRDFDRYEAWRFYLYSNGTGYFSSEGKRWWEGFDLQLMLLLLHDPRVLLEAIESASFERTVDVSSNEARLFTAELDDDAFLQQLPPELRDASEGGVREFLAGITVQLWIDADDHRVLKLAVQHDLSQRPQRPGNTPPPPGSSEPPPPEAYQRLIQYRNVEIPANVEAARTRMTTPSGKPQRRTPAALASPSRSTSAATASIRRPPMRRRWPALLPSHGRRTSSAAARCGTPKTQAITATSSRAAV